MNRKKMANDDYMTRPIKSNKANSDKVVTVFNNLNEDKIKNPHKYHKELTIKERDFIIKQSVKIMEFIRAMRKTDL